jgi:cellulose synthase/poly-beta-1,6-N-acetylglucosamine synthase-like glycosyltransferase
LSIDVSIVIPIKDEQDKCISQCLESLRTLDYRGNFEIVVTKGGNRAQARNLGISKAKGAIIAFIDSDCMASRNWLSSLVVALKRDKALGGIGGINYSPRNDSSLSRAIDFVFSSFMGSLGSASLGTASRQKRVSALACINSAYWHSILQRIGGFDEEYELCEDTNLSYKVRDAGYELLFDSNIIVWHYRRDTLVRFAKQFLHYGMGRMRSMLTARRYANKGSTIPFFIAFFFPVLTLVFPLVAASMLAAYLTAVFMVGIHGASRAKNTRFILLIPGLFVVEHLSYFFGMIYGATKGKWKKKQERCEIFLHEIVRDLANIDDAIVGAVSEGTPLTRKHDFSEFASSEL